MFVPHHFHLEDREAIAEILRDFNFALLVTAGPEGLEATHLPLLHEPETKGEGFGHLLGHLARGNGQCRAIERLAQAGGEALAVFQGPHAYVSPTWYGDSGPATVPTWNYLAVHIYGQPRLHTEPEATESILKKLAARQVRGQAAVVDDHGNAVSGQADVHLQGRDANGERPAKARQSVLRSQAPGTAMPLRVEA